MSGRDYNRAVAYFVEQMGLARERKDHEALARLAAQCRYARQLRDYYQAKEAEGVAQVSAFKGRG